MTIDEIPTAALFDWWITQVSMNIYEFMEIEAHRFGYDVSRHDLRRELKRRLRKHNLIPQRRPATSTDYAAARDYLRQLRIEDDELN